MTTQNAKAGLRGALIISAAMQEWLKEQGQESLLAEITNARTSYRQTLKAGHPTNYENRSPEELIKLKAKYQGLLRRIAMAEAVGIAAEV